MSGSKRVGATPQITPTAVRQRTVQTSAAMEVFQLADELSYISGVAAVVFAVTLVVRAALISVAACMTLYKTSANDSPVVCRVWQPALSC